MKIDGTFSELIQSIQTAHRELAAQAGRAVNITLTRVFYQLYRQIVRTLSALFTERRRGAALY